ncbi:MAG: dihydrofolate reductase [Muribaculaceae bacterium]|nr:dihydrofolate reductase [Muribaculaceae bacterium]
METSILFTAVPDIPMDKEMTQLLPFSTYNSATLKGRDIRAVVAMNADRVIGKEGTLPWRLPEDLRHFKELTMGHPVVMGRKTWESLPKRPLPGRRNIVVSHDRNYHAEGAEVFNSVEEALEACREVPYVIGGAEIYRTALPWITSVCLTSVDYPVEDADAFFPELPADEWRMSERTEKMESKNGICYRFVNMVRR